MYPPDFQSSAESRNWKADAKNGDGLSTLFRRNLVVHPVRFGKPGKVQTGVGVDAGERAWQSRRVTAAEIIREIKALPREEQRRVLTEAIEEVSAHERKEIAKLLQRVQRRLEHPEIPEDVWEGFEQAEDGKLVDLDTALTQPYPPPTRP